MKKLLKLILCLAMATPVVALTSCNKNKEPEPIQPIGDSEAMEAAKQGVYDLYKNKGTVTGDFDVVAKYADANITWSVAKVTETEEVAVTVGETSADGKKVTINVVQSYNQEIKVKLIAELDINGEKGTVEFELTVPQFVVMSGAEFYAAKKGDAVVVKGIITGIMSKKNGNSYNCLYLQDGAYGYYVYGMEKDPVADLNLAVGNTVLAKGELDIYSGTYEVKNGTVELLDNTTAVPAAADYTEIYKNAASLTTTALVEKQSALVTIKGVEITGQETGSGYYKFKLADKESYVRISSSVCPLVKKDQTTFINTHSSKLGYVADVTGVICVYNGAFYLTPVTKDAFTNFRLPELSAGDQITFVKDRLSIASEWWANMGSEIQLPTGGAFEDVKIAWASNNDNCVVDPATGKLAVTVPAGKDTTVKLTATLTNGEEAPQTREFSLVLKDLANYVEHAGTEEDPYSIEDATWYCKSFGDKVVSNAQVWVRGIVSSSSYSADYKNYTIWLQSSDGKTAKAFELYAAVIDQTITTDYAATDALKGKTVVCVGFAEQYGTTFELTKQKVGEETVYPTIKVVSDKIDVATTALAFEETSANLTVGAELQLAPIATPVDGNSAITWESSDPAVATVENGKVTAVAEGSAVITAKVSDSIKATVTVSVLKAYTYTELEKFDFTSDLTAYKAYNAADMDAFIKGSTTAGEGQSKYLSHDATGAATNPLIGANGGSDPNKWARYDLLKLGSTSKNSKITLNFAEGSQIGKVVLKACGWTGKNVSLSINGGAAQTIVSYDVSPTDADFVEYTFTFAPSDSITLESTLCSLITEMVVYSASISE